MMNETEILEKLPSLLALNQRIAAGAGDDCAVIDIPGENQLLAAVDQVIENIHFLPETPAAKAGQKLMNRNLSDIAAMGGTPLTALLTVAVNGKSASWVEEFICGAAEAGQKFNVPVCGGDTASLPQPGAVATLTILGEVPNGMAVMRSGAKPGDLIYVTGCIGNSFYSGHHLDFTPQLEAGVFLRKYASAMLDISDGLLLDAERMAKSSHVSIMLDLEKVPLRNGAAAPAAFSDGEDYELLFAAPRHFNGSTGCPAQVTCIGRVVEADKHLLINPDNTPIITGKSGYVHR